MRFAPEPEHRPDAAPPSPRTAILLCNLGTPDEPTAPAVRRYLAEFLSDPRVVEIPRLFWWPILHGVVLRVRPAKSAARYAGIWLPEGSPLKVWTEKQAKLLLGYLGQRGHRVAVKVGMRYGCPSIPSALDALRADGVQRVLVLPLYPQYCGATTATVFDQVGTWARRRRALPELRFVNGYAGDAGYIEALVKRVNDHWMAHGEPERLVLSFHGVPRRSVRLGDPYERECKLTARLLAERLRLKPPQVLVTFQSRFGKAEWLQPYTEPTLMALAREGVKRVDVMCPGFTADCLETLEEIGQEARAAFLAAGGAEFHLVACLNDQHEWMAALAELAIRHLQGWPTGRREPPGRTRPRDRALDMGAAP
jgi:ferrochelatase